METTERTQELHCPSCLDGRHRGCHVYTPTKWEGGGGRCVCKCRARKDSRLTKIERKSEAVQPKPSKPAPKPVVKRVRVYAHDYARPTKWGDDKLRELVNLSAQGHTSRQIGELVGCHMDTVRTYLAVARKKGIRA